MPKHVFIHTESAAFNPKGYFHFFNRKERKGSLRARYNLKRYPRSSVWRKKYKHKPAAFKQKSQHKLAFFHQHVFIHTESPPLNRKGGCLLVPRRGKKVKSAYRDPPNET